MLSPAMISLPWRPDAAEYYFSSLSSRPWAMLLHSGFAEHPHNRFDIVVAQPRATLVTRGQTTVINEGETVITSDADPLTLVHQKLARFNLHPQPHPHLPFLGGALVTLPLLLLRMTGGRQIKRLIRGYVELFQGTPLLMQLFLAFFGVALFGIDVSAWTAASLALTLYTSAFLLDIWFGSIRALPKGQWEASRCLGLSFGQTLYRVVAPQALRIAIAPTVGFAVQVIKGTALASIIGFVELTKAGTMLTNVTYQPFKVFALVALGYFILCYPLSRYSRYLENKFNASHHH